MPTKKSVRGTPSSPGLFSQQFFQYRRISQVRDVNIHALYLRVFAAVIILKVNNCFQLSTHFTELYWLENAFQTGIVYAIMMQSSQTIDLFLYPI